MVRQLRSLGSSVLVQTWTPSSRRAGDWQVVTKRQPTEEEWRDLVLAWRVCGRTTSNAIAVVPTGRPWASERASRSRVVAAEIAVQKAGVRAKGGAGASDAFFPFPDGLLVLADAGVTTAGAAGGIGQGQRSHHGGGRGRSGHGHHGRTAFRALMSSHHSRRRVLAARIRAEVADRVGRAGCRGLHVGSAPSYVGATRPSARYVAMKHEDCASVGIYSAGRAPALRSAKPG